MLVMLILDTDQVARPSGMPEQNTKDKQDVGAARRHWINYLERNQSIIVQVTLASHWSICVIPASDWSVLIILSCPAVLRPDEVCGQVLPLPRRVSHLQGVHKPHPAPSGAFQQVNTDLSLVNTCHVTRILLSYWFRQNT